MGFSRPEYWRELPYPSPGDLPNPGIELATPALQEDSLPSEPPGKMWKISILNSEFWVLYHLGSYQEAWQPNLGFEETLRKGILKDIWAEKRKQCIEEFRDLQQQAKAGRGIWVIWIQMSITSTKHNLSHPLRHRKEVRKNTDIWIS